MDGKIRVAGYVGPDLRAAGAGRGRSNATDAVLRAATNGGCAGRSSSGQHALSSRYAGSRRFAEFPIA